jgi:hypothetical protein
MPMSRFNRAAAAACLLLASALPAAAAVCDGSANPCTLDLGKVGVEFPQGAFSYAADALMTNGSDGYAGFASGFLPTLAEIHGAGTDGFSFNPQIVGNVGGSGINGVHEVQAFFEFNDIAFLAQPGYKIDQIDFIVSGSSGRVGDSSVDIVLPGPLVFNGEAFTSTAVLGAATTKFRGEFTINAVYVDGGADPPPFYGTANASFDKVSLVAHVSAVPEPQHAALLLAGLLVLGAAGPRLLRAGARRNN